MSASCEACRNAPSAATASERRGPARHPGRARQVAGKRWVVDLNARQEATLQLSSVNLPGGVQVRAPRRRSRAAPVSAAAVAPCLSVLYTGLFVLYTGALPSSLITDYMRSAPPRQRLPDSAALGSCCEVTMSHAAHGKRGRRTGGAAARRAPERGGAARSGGGQPKTSSTCAACSRRAT